MIDLIKLDQKKEICLLYFKEGFSKRKIAKKLRVHRDTVTKCINELERVLKENRVHKEESVDWGEIINELIIVSTYDSSNREKTVLTKEFIRFVEEQWGKSKDKNRISAYLKAREENSYVNTGVETFGYTSFCEAIKKIEVAKK